MSASPPPPSRSGPTLSHSRPDAGDIAAETVAGILNAFQSSFSGNDINIPINIRIEQKFYQHCHGIAEASRSEGFVTREHLTEALDKLLKTITNEIPQALLSPQRKDSASSQTPSNLLAPNQAVSRSFDVDGVEEARQNFRATTSDLEVNQPDVSGEQLEQSDSDSEQEWMQMLEDLDQHLKTLKTFWNKDFMNKKVDAFRDDIATLKKIFSPNLQNLSIALNSVKEFVCENFPPTYTLSTDAFCKVKAELKQRDQERPLNLYGLYIRVWRPLASLYRSQDNRPKQRSVLILLISIVDAGVKAAFKEWLRQEGLKAHKNGNSWTLKQICVLNKIRETLCGVQVTFKIAESKGDCAKIQVTNDAGPVFKILCFKIAERKTLIDTCKKWDEIQQSALPGSRPAPPDVLLGCHSQPGPARLKKPPSPPNYGEHEVSVPEASRSLGERMSKDIRASSEPGTSQDCGARTPSEDSYAQNFGTKLYIECAAKNSDALKVLFPTLIGCATAYLHFDPARERRPWATSGKQ